MLPMLDVLADLLSLIVQPCYDLTGNWWAAILLFTLIIKVMLMPMSLWCQMNSIVMVKIMPDINRIKTRFFGDNEAIGEKQNALYKEEHYHPLLSLVPLAVQIVILFGLVEVIHGITDYGAPGTEFLGMVPVEDGGLSWIMPVLAGLSAVVMGYAQNRINPLQREQSKLEKNMTNGMSIALSFVLGMFVAAGMAFYWICSNLSAIAIQALCNVIIKPEKHIDYDDLASSRIQLDELNALSSDRPKWYQKDPLTKREKADYKRFFNIVNKHVVFYSERSGFYKYFEGAIEWLLSHSDVRIHYVTNDPNDQIFGIAQEQPRILPYFIDDKRFITLMMKMDADIVVATLEDLENYYVKRSYVRKDTEYIFMFHHMTSTSLVANKGSYDHYDSILCVGQHQIDELKRAEELYDTTRKNLVPCGYDLLDREIRAVASMDRKPHERPVVLIAPSWQEDCILDICIQELLDPLIGQDYRVIVRPHPEYVKRYRPRWESLMKRYEDVSPDRLYFEGDFSETESIFTSDILITDWSSIACEFSFSTLKPSVFIDTPMKMANPEYKEINENPIDITLRNDIGMSLAPEELGEVVGIVAEMLSNPERWSTRIEEVMGRTIFNPGRGGEVAGEYILGRILAKQELKSLEGDDVR